MHAIKSHWVGTHVVLRCAVVSLVVATVVNIVGVSTINWTATNVFADFGEVNSITVGLWKYCQCIHVLDKDFCECRDIIGDRLTG